MEFGSSGCLIFLFLYFSLLGQLAKFVASLEKPQSLCHDHERSALFHFKQSFVIDCVLASGPSYGYPKVSFWKSGDCCKWDGVKCDKRTGHVIALDLSYSCLYGSFPSNSSIFYLDHLLELNLANNHFNYSLIPDIIGRLHGLRRFNASASVFSGQIPYGLLKLSSLSVLDLSFNGDPLSGSQSPLKLQDPSIGKLVNNLSHLTEIHLDQVDTSSKLPLPFSNLTTLKAIYLSGCNLYGEIPGSILLLPNLEEVDLRYNENLRGYLPEFPPNSPLRYLAVFSTAFSGELPSSVGNLGLLDVLDLGNCNFYGMIPSSLGNLTNLRILNLAGNTFGGNIPPSITNITKLVSLGLSDLNVILENLSPWLSQLHNLTKLRLVRMDSGGKFPDSIKNLTHLNNLDLSSNQIFSPLPPWVGNMTLLTGLHLQNNRLQGPCFGQI